MRLVCDIFRMVGLGISGYLSLGVLCHAGGFRGQSFLKSRWLKVGKLLVFAFVIGFRRWVFFV